VKASSREEPIIIESIPSSRENVRSRRIVEITLKDPHGISYFSRTPAPPWVGFDSYQPYSSQHVADVGFKSRKLFQAVEGCEIRDKTTV